SIHPLRRKNFLDVQPLQSCAEHLVEATSISSVTLSKNSPKAKEISFDWQGEQAALSSRGSLGRDPAVNLSLHDMIEFCTSAFEAVGLSHEHAGIVADNLVGADADGVRTH